MSLEQSEILLSSLTMNTVSFTPVSPQHPPHMLAIEALCTNIPYRHALDTVHTEGVPGTLCEIWLCLFQMGLFVLQQKHLYLHILGTITGTDIAAGYATRSLSVSYNEESF